MYRNTMGSSAMVITTDLLNILSRLITSN